jgi:hypothetical protein
LRQNVAGRCCGREQKPVSRLETAKSFRNTIK